MRRLCPVPQSQLSPPPPMWVLYLPFPKGRLVAFNRRRFESHRYPLLPSESWARLNLAAVRRGDGTLLPEQLGWWWYMSTWSVTRDTSSGLGTVRYCCYKHIKFYPRGIEINHGHRVATSVTNLEMEKIHVRRKGPETWGRMHQKIQIVTGWILLSALFLRSHHSLPQFTTHSHRSV